MQIYEKYQQLARDSSAAGDRISAENLLQHAEHYFRIHNASAAANGGDRRPRQLNGQNGQGIDGDESDESGSHEAGDGADAAAENDPAEQAQT